MEIKYLNEQGFNKVAESIKNNKTEIETLKTTLETDFEVISTEDIRSALEEGYNGAAQNC